MTDVIGIARDRQARLASEIGRLDNFIAMAEALVKQSRSESNIASDTESEGAAELASATNVRPSSATAGGMTK